MKRMAGWIAAAAMLFSAGGATAVISQAAMPDISRQHYERQNCHGAYDVLVEQLDNGSRPSEAEVAWAKSYEDNAANGQPCPAPPADLAVRASNRTVVTQAGLAKLAAYHKQGDATAYFEAANTVLTGKTDIVGPEVGWELLGQAVRLGEPSAQYFLGLLTIGGVLGKADDYAGGLPHIENAARAGHVDALFQAGNMYAAGLGTKKDSRKAFDYYRQAAERGHVFAAYQTAVMANDGDGVKKDHALAYRLARNLADQGEVVGAVLAASALLQQKNVKEHEDEVLYWMDVAMRDGDESIRSEMAKYRPQVQEAYKRLNAPPEYTPRVRKACPMKTVCLVNSSGVRWQCTTNKDYWNDCDG
jgi:TPR repeat protein